MKHKIVIATGGTGGHIFPAMALAEKLQMCPNLQILFVGGKLKTNRYFEKERFPFQEITSGSLSLLRPLCSFRSLWKIWSGIRQSRRILKEFSPNLVVGFGSHYTLPMLLAAKMESLPIILHEANRIPGRVNRLLSPYIHATAVHFPDTISLLKGRAIPTDLPLRSEYRKEALSSMEARHYYKLNMEFPVLLIFGGSQGARAINSLASAAVSLLPLKQRHELQILHFTGDRRSALQLSQFYKECEVRTAIVKEFEPFMNIAWAAADLLISRSGAGTIAEQTEYELPGILIPYPHATDDHQESNADYMVNIVKGGVMYKEKTLSPTMLMQKLSQLLKIDGSEFQSMRAAIQCHKKIQSAQPFFELILKEIASHD